MTITLGSRSRAVGLGSEHVSVAVLTCVLCDWKVLLLLVSILLVSASYRESTLLSTMSDNVHAETYIDGDESSCHLDAEDII